MDNQLKKALQTISSGDIAAALVTITRVKGSTPRKPGAKMLLLPDGQVFGTIGGGCGEAEVRRVALDAIASLMPMKYSVNMTNNLAAEEGMVCGGIMDVFIEIINPGNWEEKELLTSYLASLEAGEEPVMVTITSYQGETQHLGRKLFLTACGTRKGDLGSEELNSLAESWSEQIRSDGKTRTIMVAANSQNPEWELLLEPPPTPVELLILGGGHIALPLATMANILGYRVTVVDDRPAFANRVRFPMASQVICQDFVQAIRQIQFSPRTYIVIVTRGHRHDKLCLQEVVGQPSAYIGMIGSQRRVKALMSELQEEGLPPESLTRVHSPIGLDIAAENPEEIAVSILAEIINVHRGGRA